MRGTKVIIATLWILPATTASAQSGAPKGATQQAIRPDISGSIGWLNGNKSELDSSHDWYNRGVHGALTFGWHWSTHLKTELEASASSRARFQAASEEVLNGARAFVNSEHSFRTRRLTLLQQYQFGENAWFHPHLAAGVDFNRERISRFDREVYFYEPAARQSSVVRQAVRHPDRTEVHTRPVVSAGFKAYVTPRAFVRSDLRIVSGSRVEEVLLRFGVGVDF
jgi:hypothetical protein